MPFAVVVFVAPNEKLMKEFGRKLDELEGKGASYVFYRFDDQWYAILPHVMTAVAKVLGDYDLPPHLPPGWDEERWKKELVEKYVAYPQFRARVDRLEKILDFLDGKEMREGAMKIVETDVKEGGG